MQSCRKVGILLLRLRSAKDLQHPTFCHPFNSNLAGALFPIVALVQIQEKHFSSAVPVNRAGCCEDIEERMRSETRRMVVGTARFLLLFRLLVFAKCTAVPTSVAAGYSITCVSFNNSRVKCFGKQYWYTGGDSRLGNDPNEMGLRLPYVDFGTDLQLTSFVLLERNPSFWDGAICGIFGSRGEIKCRPGRYLSLGIDEDLAGADLGIPMRPVQITLTPSGTRDLCVLLADEIHVVCGRGRNRDVVTKYAEKVQKLLQGCVLLKSGKVMCADLDSGSVDISQGRQETFALDFGLGRRVTDFVGGETRYSTRIWSSSGEKYEASYLAHSCALLDNGDVKCFGDNDAGQLGQGDTTPRGLNTTRNGRDLDPIDLGTNLTVAQVAVSSLGVAWSRVLFYRTPIEAQLLHSGHTCVLFSSGRVKCFGLNSFGQLGLGDSENRGDNPGEMGDSLPFVDLGENVSAVQLALGRFHTCVLLDNFEVKCFGRNYHGQLGLEDTKSRGILPGQMGENLPAISFFGNYTKPTVSPTHWPTYPEQWIPPYESPSEFGAVTLISILSVPALIVVLCWLGSLVERNRLSRKNIMSSCCCSPFKAKNFPHTREMNDRGRIQMVHPDTTSLAQA